MNFIWGARMIRFGIFFCVVSALYLIGQKEQAVVRPKPVAIPMTVTFDGTRVGAPPRAGSEWPSNIEFHDQAPMLSGFDPSLVAFAASTGLTAAPPFE